MNKLIKKILCLVCSNELESHEKNFKCKKCSKKYIFDHGIFMMLPHTLLRDEQNIYQKRYYEEHYKTEYANRDFEWRKRWVTRLINFLPKNKNSTILDLACGQGYMTLAVAKKGYKVIACDISVSGLKRARKEAKKLGIEKNILFIACDINTIKFKKNTFGFIIMLHVLEHLINDKQIVKNIISFANPKAIYYIGVPLSLGHVFPLFIPLYMYSDRKVGHKRRYTIENILRLFSFRAEPVYTIYTGHLIKFLGLFLSKIGINKWERKIEDLDEKMLTTKLWASNITTVIKRKN